MIYWYLNCTEELLEFPNSWIYKTGIFTVNFCIELHVDCNDHRLFSKDSLLSKLCLVSESRLLSETSQAKHACALYDLVNTFDAA
jgi:hypothetical protein